MHKEIIFPQHCTPWSHNPLAPIHVPKNPAMYHNEPPVPLHAPKRHPCSPCMYQNDIPAPICMYQNDTAAPLCMYQNDTPIKSCTKTNPLCRNVPKRCVPEMLIKIFRIRFWVIFSGICLLRKRLRDRSYLLQNWKDFGK